MRCYSKGIPAERPSGILAAQLALATLVVALLTTRGVTTGDEAVHLDLAIGIVERGETTLSIDPGELSVPSRKVSGGLFYQADDGLRSASTPALAWIAVPFVAIGSAFAEGPPPSFDPLFRESRAPVSSVLRPIARDPRTIAFTLIGPLCAALAVLFTAFAAIDLGASRRAIVIGASALALGSPLFAYAGTCWPQLPVAALLAFVLWRMIRGGVGSVAIASALAVLVRPELFVLAIATGAALFWKERSIPVLVRYLAVLAIAIGVLVVWGMPEAGGWSIARLPLGALGLLVSPRTGLAFYAPLTLLAIVLVRKLPPPIATLVTAWLALAVVMYGGWFDWPASLAYGPRFLVPVLPGLALALIAAYDAVPAERIPTWIACALGFAITLPGALVAHVRIDEPDDFFHPTFMSAWRELANGVDSTSTYLTTYPLLAFAAVLVALVISRYPRAET